MIKSPFEIDQSRWKGFADPLYVKTMWSEGNSTCHTKKSLGKMNNK